MIIGLGHFSVGYKSLNLKDRNSKANYNNSLCLNSCSLSCDQISFKGKKAYTYNDYKNNFANTMAMYDKEAVSATEAEKQGLFAILSEQFRGVKGLVQQTPKDIELCDSLLEVALKLSKTEEFDFKNITAAKKVLNDTVSSLENSPKDSLNNSLKAELSSRLYNLEHPNLNSVPQHSVSSAKNWEHFDPEVEMNDLLKELNADDQYNLTLLKEGNDKLIVKKAGASLVKRGRFDLVNAFLRTVPQKDGLFLKKNHGEAVFNIATTLSEMRENNVGVKGFIGTIQADGLIDPAVKKIINCVLRFKGK